MSDKKPQVLVGCCGFAEARERMFEDFDILEVQRSFYQPPMVKTAERWRREAPSDFVFTMKAWQLLTHESTSPTYQKLTERLSKKKLAQVGSFRWNDVTKMAWERTLEIADALDAQGILFQMPQSFGPTGENLVNMSRFFKEVDRAGRRLVFEPRSDEWDDDILRQICEDLDLVHAVDPFLRPPVGRGIRYYRLHGKPAYNYSYTYTDAELDTLAGKMVAAWPDWVLFNNDSMADDARRFIARIR
ncbi:MAG: DUF72 domain-containing protein [Myxococcota bacterium]